MEDNERKDGFENENENNFENPQNQNENSNEYQNEQQSDPPRSFGYSSQQSGTGNGYGSRPQNNNGYYPGYPNASRGYYPQGSYTNGRSAAAKSSRKLVIISVAVVAAVILAAIVGIAILYNNVLKPLIGDPDGGLGGQGGLPTGIEIIDEDFDLTQPSQPGTPFTSLPDAYDDTHKVFVEIYTTYAEDGGVGAGSGFIVARMKDNKGYYIVTNNHVVEDATKITVKLYDGRTYTAHETVLRDEMTDIAVIAIEESGVLPVAKLGKSSNIRVGEPIYIIGNPLGTLAGTLTNGIVSSKAVEIYMEPHYMELIQTNAAINPGNSGGPMFNMSGEIIGIVNSKYVSTSIEGIGFAIPMDTAITVIEQMIRQGYVSGRHDLGITTQHDLYGIGGLWISGIDENSSLLKAGMPYNSMYCYQINSINGMALMSSVQANSYLDGLEAGDTVTISISIYEMQFSRLVPVAQKTYTVTLGQKLATE